MDTTDKIILVTGATGRQGGTVARHLVQDGWRVRALTRRPEQPNAQRLRDMGIEVYQGDLNTITGDHPALKDLYGIYSVQNAWEAGFEGEIREGNRLADVGKEAGIKHFVYSSVGAAERRTGIPHFDSKWQIEEHIRGLGLPYTIFRPVFFMDNFLSKDFRTQIAGGTLRMALKPDKPLQLIAVTDIGAFVAMAFRDPDTWLGKELELAGDELTMPRVAEIADQALGIPIRYEELPIEQVRQQSPETALMFEWFNREGYKANIVALRQMYPPLLTFEAWVRRLEVSTELIEEGVLTSHL
jgi:uncharacterized protein YbjT (DUF2867 family)